MPASIAAAKPSRASATPRSQPVCMIGVASTPASAPIAAETAKVGVVIAPVSTPTSRAATPSSAVASTALAGERAGEEGPQAPRTPPPRPPSPTGSAAGARAPRSRLGSSPEKLGRRWSRLSKAIRGARRTKVEAPMVTVTRLMTGAPGAGSMASR